MRLRDLKRASGAAVPVRDSNESERDRRVVALPPVRDLWCGASQVSAAMAAMHLRSGLVSSRAQHDLRPKVSPFIISPDES